MKNLLLFLPFLLSWLNGHLLLAWIFNREPRPSFSLTLPLSFGLGLGVSSFVTFLSFLTLNSFQPGFVVGFHLLMIFVSGIKFLSQKEKWTFRFIPLSGALPFCILGLAMVPFTAEGLFYPLGGWDAWSVWNYKAKFLFLAGTEWRDVFAPDLWRSSPHYPLLLPLINVWGWVFFKTPVSLGPLVVAGLFTFLTAALLYGTLKDLTKNRWTLVAPLLFLTLPVGNTFAASQYCDVVISFYLLAALFCLIKTGKTDDSQKGYSILGGIFLGLLSFTKPEGAVAAALTALFYNIIWVRAKQPRTPERIHSFLWFLASLSLASMATMFFQVFLSPGNQTFINGFLSTDKPVNLYRLEIVFVFLWVELINGKWNGLWLLCLAGIVLGGKKLWRGGIILVPLVLLAYLGTVLFYYVLNTYFKIEWWLQVTLSRILFSLLPVVLFWIFHGFTNKTAGND